MNETRGAQRNGKRVAAFGTAVAVALAGTAVAAPPAYATQTGERRILQTALDDLRNLGMAGAQGQVSWGRHSTATARSGVADRRTGAPMPVGGRFRIGSNTKTFVAVVVLQLVGEGRLGLDDTVEHWLPGVVAGNGNDGSAITVRQLLQHTSGLFNFTAAMPALTSAEEFQRHRYDHFEPADLVALAMTREPLFEPGERWEYSNTNYVLAGMIIAKVTGRPWAAEVRRRIAGPLGLRDTSYPGDRVTLPRSSAHAYQQFAPGGALLDVTAFNPTAADAAGGMVSTTADLARFWRALQRGELLAPAQQAEMHRTVLADSLQEFIPGIEYGLGVFRVPNRCGGYWAHPGDVPGTSTVNAVTADGGRAVVAYRTTGLADSQAVDTRAFRLLDDLICRSG